MRQVFLAPDGQPFIIAGTGTLAMETTAANLVETGDQVLVVNTGYFGDRMGDILTRYGARVTHVRAPVGDRPLLEMWRPPCLPVSSKRFLSPTSIHQRRY
jgi:alanine-glyoxylate transaminase/serine-glyoxylate transaminase/serine-pyruvate transaminase